VPIPDDVPDDIAVLSELCSVSYQALTRVKTHLERAHIALFGDGPVGYLTSAVLHHMFGVEQTRIHIFGAMPDKLSNFPFTNRSLVQEYDFKKEKGTFDLVIECTGGRFSESAINQGIDLLKTYGHLLLMGVSEERVPINTRDVLEKGLTLIGTSRSCYTDYIEVISAMRESSFQAALRSIVPSIPQAIRGADDFRIAMAEAAAHRDWKKTLLEFQWH
jgi:ribitol-5-phosphate 2-dehydrogenase